MTAPDSAKAGTFILDTRRRSAVVRSVASTSRRPTLSERRDGAGRTPSGLDLHPHLSVDEARSTANGSTARSWRGLPVAGPARAGDRGGPGQAEHADALGDRPATVSASAQRHASRPITSGGSQPGAAVDPPRPWALRTRRRRSTPRATPRTATPALLGPVAHERERRAGLGLRVGPRVGEPRLARPSGRRAHETLVGGRRRAARALPETRTRSRAEVVERRAT